MKEKICSALRFLIRFLRLLLLTLSGKKHLDKKRNGFSCETQSEEKVNDPETNS